MAHYYLDSSALVKRYVAEIGTGWVTNRCAAASGHTLYTVRVSGPEIIAALFCRVSMGSLSAAAAAAANQFKADFRNQYQVVEVNEPLIERAMLLAEKHTLRGYDSVQLASALELHSVRAVLRLPLITFVCADNQLNASAIAEGLPAESPNNYP